MRVIRLMIIATEALAWFRAAGRITRIAAVRRYLRTRNALRRNVPLPGQRRQAVLACAGWDIGAGPRTSVRPPFLLFEFIHPAVIGRRFMTGPGVILRTLDGRIAVNRGNSEGNHNRDYVCNKQHLFTELVGRGLPKKAQRGRRCSPAPFADLYQRNRAYLCNSVSLFRS